MMTNDNLVRLDSLVRAYEEAAASLAQTDPFDDSFWPKNYKLRALAENIDALYELETRRLEQWSADRDAFTASASEQRH